MSLQNTAIGVGLGLVIWRYFGGILSLLFLVVVVLSIADCSNPPYGRGWSYQVSDEQKPAIISEFPDATNEQRSDILIMRAKIERLKADLIDQN